MRLTVCWTSSIRPALKEIVEETIGATLPTLGALSEIETSSRLRSQGGILYMSTPSAAGRPEGAQTTPPLGFVLSTDRLVTVRFMPLPSFDAVASKFASSNSFLGPASRFSPCCAKRLAKGLRMTAGR